MKLAGIALIIILAALAALSAARADKQCVTVDQAQEINCAGWKPVWPNSTDKLTASTWAAIKANDDRGVRMGCWEYPQ